MANSTRNQFNQGTGLWANNNTIINADGSFQMGPWCWFEKDVYLASKYQNLLCGNGVLAFGFGDSTSPPNGSNFRADINGSLNYNGSLYCNGV